MNDKENAGKVIFSNPPERLPDEEVPPGVIQCRGEVAVDCARFALSNLQNSEAGFPMRYLPRPSLYRCALLGSYDRHDQNFQYDARFSLKEVIENKVNAANSDKYLIAVMTRTKYYCFQIKKFHYDILYEIQSRTYSITFILLLPGVKAGYVLFHDAPTVYMFSASRTEFEKDFMSPEEAKSIFSSHMIEWRNSTRESEAAWLRRVRDDMQSDEIVSDDVVTSDD